MTGCSKDMLLEHYNNVLQIAGTAGLTREVDLTGTREYGADPYTGTYLANYRNFSRTEYLFGGTALSRRAGAELSVTCTLQITGGSAKVFWRSGSDDPVTLLETDGAYSGAITLPAGSNYIGIEGDNFTGTLNLSVG